jgi:Head domain of trimeric autotransporter adhesin
MEKAIKFKQLVIREISMKKLLALAIAYMLSFLAPACADNFYVPGGGGGGSTALPSGAQPNQLLGYPNTSPAWVNALSGINFSTIANAYSSPVQLLGTEPSVLPVDVTNGDSTIVLPAAASCPNKIYYFVAYDPSLTGNGIFLNTHGSTSDQILGASSPGQTSILIRPTVGAYGLISDGFSKWYSLNTVLMDSSPQSSINAVFTMSGQPMWASTLLPSPWSSGTYGSYMILTSNSFGQPVFGFGLSGINSSTYTGTNTLTGLEPTTVLSDSTSALVTLNLPAASLVPGKVYVFEQVAGTNNTSLAANGSDNIETSPTYSITANQQPIMLQSDGVSVWRYLALPGSGGSGGPSEVLTNDDETGSFPSSVPIVGSGTDSIVLDPTGGSVASATNAIAIGHNVTANGPNTIAIGYSMASQGTDSVKVGGGGGVSVNYGTALGFNTSISGTSSVALGYASTDGGTSNVCSIGNPGTFGRDLIGVSHILTYTVTPVAVLSTGAGTGPSHTYTGSDTGGLLSITTGSSPAGSNAIIATINYEGSNLFPTGSFVTLTPGNANAASLSGATQVYAVGGTGSWVLHSGSSALSAATNYLWNVNVTGY